MGWTANRSRASESIVSIVALVLLSGMITSAYIVAVHYTAVQGRRQNAVEQAVVVALEQLLEVTTDDPRFGRIGLADRAGSTRVMGINTLMASLRLDLLIAERLGLRNIAAMVNEDLESADIVRAKLRERVLQAAFAENTTDASQGKSIWTRVGKILAESTRNTGERLTTYSVSLGHLTKPMITTTPSPDFEQTFSQNNNYLSGMDIAMPQGKPLRFTELRPKMTFVNPTLFTPEPQYLPPSVVRVQATFDLPAQGKTPARKVVRSACAVLGAPFSPPPAASLLVSFPFGAPPQFDSMRSLLSFSNWTGSGTWLQATGGQVPGQGHLTSTLEARSESILPQQAVQVAFYHWLLQSGPGVKIERVRELLDTPWRIAENETESRQNSALTYETGARSYAVINQSGPGQKGQQLLSEAFKAKVSSRSFPQSALPLFIDRQGNCNLPGRNGMDKDFVVKFINDLYETNIASVESHKIAGTVLNRMNHALEQQMSNLSMEKEELHSVDQRLARLRAQNINPENSATNKDLQQQQTLKKDKQDKIATIVQRIKEHEAVRARARLALRNADIAWLATWEIGSKLNYYTRGGLHRVGSPRPGYLLNVKQVFIPQIRPLSEDDIYAQRGLQSPPVEESSWLSSNFQVLPNAEDNFIVEGLPFADARNRFRAPTTAPQGFLAWTTAQLSSDQKLEVRRLRQSPFDNSGIEAEQLAYLAADAIRTGQTPEVTWTLLIRDEVAYKGAAGGEPVPGHPGWCSQNTLTFEECPGLACEIQLRAPLPLLRDLPAAPSVIGPSGQERVSLIPPTPLSML